MFQQSVLNRIKQHDVLNVGVSLGFKGFSQRDTSRNGGNRPHDGFVLTNQVGATQFSRNGEQYIREVNSVNQNVADLMAVTDEYGNESLFLNRTLEAGFLEQGIHFGSARFKNGYACFATFRRWLDNGVMSLMPHEDMAQIDFAREDDFEIANTPLMCHRSMP